jgi:transcriptional regulator with XRE-family HTH domain
MLRKLRESRDMSMAALAAKAKVTDAYIAMLETGTRKNPSLAILKRLAKALGVPVTELLE